MKNKDVFCYRDHVMLMHIEMRLIQLPGIKLRLWETIISFRKSSLNEIIAINIFFRIFHRNCTNVLYLVQLVSFKAHLRDF